LLFQHQFAVDAAGPASIERLIEHGQRVPVSGAAVRSAVADGDAGQRAEFFLDFADALALEWRRAKAKPDSGVTSPRISKTAFEGA
jgi:hypothetical protein